MSNVALKLAHAPETIRDDLRLTRAATGRRVRQATLMRGEGDMSTRTRQAHSARPIMLLVAMLIIGACKSSTPEPTTEMSALPAELTAAAPVLNEVSREVPGISQRQNVLATGSLLGLAKTKMPADQFAEVARAIPGAESIIVEATRQGLPRSALTSLTSVVEYLGTQGVNQDQVTKRIIPVLDKSVKGKVTPGVEANFNAALR
jgi:hypothetical protein